MALVIGVTSWMNLARIVRSEVKQVRNSDYVIAAKCMGGGLFHIIWFHLLPNFLSATMFMIVSSMGTAILTESTLSFLGIGLPIAVVSWGSMLSLANRALLTNAWWVILIPGLFIILTLLCITNIGHFLRQRVNRGCSYL
jgi:peptide/nickel transport system permease protein